MRIKSGFELRKICRENIVISHGLNNINFTKVVSLNESAAFIWDNIKDKDFSLDDMVNLIMTEYDVDDETARKDCSQLLTQWKEVGYIED
ncbi:MAG: PqqD family protein [Bacteroidaceae bacterium]|nr:PqqD family protein [Bacteroidaceae bacterium]